MFFFLHLHIQYYHTHDGRNNAFWINAVWSYHLHNKNCFASSDRPIIILCDELVYYYLIDWKSKLLYLIRGGGTFFPRKNWCIPSGYENEDLSAAERRTNIYLLDQNAYASPKFPNLIWKMNKIQKIQGSSTYPLVQRLHVGRD